MRIVWLSFFGLAISGNISAQNIERGKINCQDQQTAYENKYCNGLELVRLDKELNLIWKRALAAIPADGTTDDRRKERKQFIAAQNSWLKYRDNQCAVEGGQQGGDNQWVTIFGQNCDIGMTKDRIKYLKEIANQK